MPRILENDAASVVQNIGSLPEDQRPEALDILKRYKQQQDDLGEPQWPSQVQASQDTQDRLRGMFKELKSVDAVAPSLAGVLPFSQNPDADRARVANTAYLATRYGKSTDEIGSSYDLYRNDYSQRFLQAPTGLDDLAFHKAAGQEIQRAEQSETATLDGVKAALRGDDIIPSLQQWQQKNGIDRMPDSTQFTKGFLMARQKSGDQLEFADTLLKQIESNTGLTKGDGAQRPVPAGQEQAAQFESSLATLAAMKPRDRKQVYAIIGAKAEAAGYDQKGFWGQMLSELGKGMARMGSTVTTQAGVTADVMSKFPEMLTNTMKPEDFASTDASIAKRQSIGEMYDEVANIVAGSVDPVKPVLGWMNDGLETGLIKGPGAVAPFMMASAALGPVGAGALFTADFAEQNRRDLRAQGMDNEQAIKIGYAAAPLQAAAESLSNAFQLGRFPAIQRVLASFTKPIGGGAGLVARYAQNAVTSLATEYTEEQLQDNVLVPATQELLGALQSDVPSVDWGMYKNRAVESTPELLGVLAPMALVFGGTMTAAQANLSSAVVSSQDMLEAAGYSAAQANSIRATAPDAQISKARELWGQRAGTPQSMEEAAKSVAERMRLLQTDHAAAQQDLEQRGILPRMLRATNDQWRLTFNDGSTADFNSHGEADAARWQWASDQLGKVHTSVQRTLAQMEKNADVGREFALQFSPDERHVTPEEMASKGMQDRVKQGELLDEVKPEQQFEDASAIGKASGDEETVHKILGSSVNTFKDGILTTMMKLYNGANITTLVEEKLEGDAKAIMADPDGKQWMLDHLRAYEQASGDKLFAHESDKDVTPEMIAEAWSHLGQSYLVGKSTDKTAWQGKSARGMFRYILNAGLSPVMNAETQYWRAVALRAQKIGELQKAGKLGNDLTATLENQLGIDSQAKHESEAAKEADAIANEALYAGSKSYSEENPGPNGETFSLRTPFTPAAFVTKKFNDRIDQWEKTGDAGREPINLGFTPPALQVAGADNLSIVVPPSLFDKVTKDAHAVPVEALRQLPQSLADPVAVFQSRRDGNAILVLTEHREAGKGPIVIAIHLNRKAGELEVNQVSSMYGRPDSDIAAMFNEQPLYVNKQKRLDQGRQVGKQYPESSTPSQGKGSIPGPEDVVKWAEAKLRDQGGATHSVRKFDFSSRLGPASATMQAMRQQGKAIDFPAIYAAAKVGQSSHMLPLDSLYEQAVKQLPGLTTAEFGKHIQALYNSGHVLLEPGDLAASMKAALDKYGLRDSLGIPSMYAGPMAEETFSVRPSVAAAKNDGFTQGPFYHSTNAAFDEFSHSARSKGSDGGWSGGDHGFFGKGFYFTENTTRQFGSNAMQVMLKMSNPLKLNAPADFKTGSLYDSARLMIDALPSGVSKAVASTLNGIAESGRLPSNIDAKAHELLASALTRAAKAAGYDGVIVRMNGVGVTEIAAFDPDQVTVIRSNETHSIRSGDFSARMAAAFSPFQRSPELRLAIAQVAKSRAARLGAEWIEKAAVLRTAGSIGKERRVREALGYDQRMQAYLDGLSPDARQDLEFEPSKLESDPLIAAMLDHGKLMSRSTAMQQGKLSDKAGEYDGVPWLPPSWYSKGAGIMPDQIAQAMHDAGLLLDGHADTLWAALAHRIEASRKDKARAREAAQGYKEASKAARVDAKLEAEAWANQASKKAGSAKSQRDMLKAALRTLDGILSAAPPEVRARVGGYVKLAGIATDEQMLKEIERRIEKLNVELEKWLKKEGVEQLEKLLKKARPDTSPGKKGKGKDADMHHLFAAAERASKMDAAAVAGELARLDSLITGDTLTPEQETLATTERGIVELLGDLKNADSGRIFSAIDTLRDIYDGGWLKWKLAEIERKERRAGMRHAFITDTGKTGLLPERQAAEKAAATLLGKIKGGFLSLSSFHEVLSYAFGEKSDRVKSLVDAERAASGQYEDVNQALADEVEALFSEMAGGVLKGERLRYDMAQPSIKTGKGEFSQLQAIQALLMWRQEDGRRHMEGAMDENGKPSGPWHYDQAWIDEITAALTPEARQLMGWIMQKYSAEWATLNPLYRARYGVNMPAHDNYAPITVAPAQTKAGEVVDPVTGAAMSSGSILTPGSLRTRSRNAIAEPEFRDALQTLLNHTRQLEYWKAYYDLAVEANAILGNREVLNAVKAKGGDQAATALRKWVDAIAQGGFRDAAASLEMNKLLNRMTGRAATVGLLGRVSTLLVQSTQLAAAAVKMPIGQYLVGMSKLLTGNLGYADAIKSDFIQRRYKTAPPIVRQAMENLGAQKKPNLIKHAARALGQFLSGADALFTAGTYSLLLDYHRGTGRALGLSGAELEKHAHTEAERDTEQVAQPTRMAARSLAEITMTNPLGKVTWAYASEARQKIAMAAWAATKATTEPVQFAKTMFLVFGVGGLMTQLLKNLWKEAKGDDDEKKWTPQRLMMDMLSSPLHGIPGIGALLNDGNMLSGPSRLKNVDFSGDPTDIMRDVDTLLSVAGMFNDTAAGVSSLSHLALDAAKVLENLFSGK